MATLPLRWLSVKYRMYDLKFKHLESLEMVEVLVISLYKTGSVRACSVVWYMAHSCTAFYKTLFYKTVMWRICVQVSKSIAFYYNLTNFIIVSIYVLSVASAMYRTILGQLSSALPLNATFWSHAAEGKTQELVRSCGSRFVL